METEERKKRKKEYYAYWIKTEAGQLAKKRAQEKYSQTIKGRISQKKKNIKAKTSGYLRKFRRSTYQRERMRKYHLWYKENRRKQYKESALKRKRRHYILYPVIEKARKRVYYATRFGKIPKINNLKCHKCPAQAIHYHHWKGYAKENALDVIPLCQTCHTIEHKGV